MCCVYTNVSFISATYFVKESHFLGYWLETRILVSLKLYQKPWLYFGTAEEFKKKHGAWGHPDQLGQYLRRCGADTGVFQISPGDLNAQSE